jgi:hypothetical protein
MAHGHKLPYKIRQVSRLSIPKPVQFGLLEQAIWAHKVFRVYRVYRVLVLKAQRGLKVLKDYRGYRE